MSRGLSDRLLHLRVLVKAGVDDYDERVSFRFVARAACVGWMILPVCPRCRVSRPWIMW